MIFNLEETNMLILSRRIEESIFIGENAEIKITVLGMQGRNVRIGIQAPKDLPVHRQEIYERIQDEKAKIAAGDTIDKKEVDDVEELDEIRGNR